MKTLYLVRHAKSSWDDPVLKDFERPLMETGIKKTRQIIKFLNDKKVSVDLIISSPAVRALETARLIAGGIGYPVENIKIEPAIYEGSADDFLDVICTTPDEINSLMIFGHNPMITYVANLFLDKVIDLLPTSGIAATFFKTDQWNKISEIRPQKEYVVYPKMLKS